ncbi:uncharacterized protein LOC132263510 [Phlebotomus argentipes]|uniref:uncharacterized protein LOC132263510 n=1 Tax=Phlebotomus argentipes TaxID=94469 RepID=UPI002892EB38|nr:uncharacterized protein LOC132263510 [Phlebotomus argentipes]
MKVTDFYCALGIFLLILADSALCQFLRTESTWKSNGHNNHTNVTCDKHLSHFEDASKDFTTQLLLNAVPVTYCNKSVKQYLRFEETYKDLLTAVDRTNVSCKDIYFNVDRLGVVETIYNQLHQMWLVGFCDDCYANVSSASLSNTTKDFYYYLESIQQCISDNKASDPCLKCMGSYQKLNDFFDGIKKEKEDRICFDLQDAMNRTRIKWSVELNCCRDRNSSLLFFYIISGLIGILPGIFYLVVFIWQRHQERYDLLTDDQDITASAETGSASIQNVSPNHEESQPGPSRVNTSLPTDDSGDASKKKAQQSVDESDDDMIANYSK